MQVDTRNETDIREEVAAPLLALLGYARGTPNDISRELTLRYEFEYLGRKKPSDPRLRGRADYILSVLGVASWVLEIKAPHEAIGVDAIEQAISYGRHPEVGASYAVVLNGLRLTVHAITQRSTEPPIVDIAVSDVTLLASMLEPLLGPAAIRRDCARPIVDLRRPVAPGLRSQAVIQRGEIVHSDISWWTNMPSLPATQHFEETKRRMSGH